MRRMIKDPGKVYLVHGWKRCCRSAENLNREKGYNVRLFEIAMKPFIWIRFIWRPDRSGFRGRTIFQRFKKIALALKRPRQRLTLIWRSKIFARLFCYEDMQLDEDRTFLKGMPRVSAGPIWKSKRGQDPDVLSSIFSPPSVDPAKGNFERGSDFCAGNRPGSGGIKVMKINMIIRCRLVTLPEYSPGSKSWFEDNCQGYWVGADRV